MNPTIKTKWLEALRSGDYKQGQLALRRIDDTFCCLGVLCDIYAQETGEKWVRGGNSVEGSYYMHDRDGYLPEQVMQWAEVDNHAGALIKIDKDLTWSLSGMNDDGKTFEEIAQVIEEYL